MFWLPTQASRTKPWPRAAYPLARGPKHLDRYVDEFSGRHNIPSDDTIDQMGSVAHGMVGQRLRYRDLIAPNGRPSGARELAR